MLSSSSTWSASVPCTRTVQRHDETSLVVAGWTKDQLKVHSCNRHQSMVCLCAKCGIADTLALRMKFIRCASRRPLSLSLFSCVYDSRESWTAKRVKWCHVTCHVALTRQLEMLFEINRWFAVADNRNFLWNQRAQESNQRWRDLLMENFVPFRWFVLQSNAKTHQIDSIDSPATCHLALSLQSLRQLKHVCMRTESSENTFNISRSPLIWL